MALGFFVNVPIGLVVVALSHGSGRRGRRHRRLDIPGVVTSTAGLALLVYGLTHAAAGQDGVSHWGDPTSSRRWPRRRLLVGFVFIEREAPTRSSPCTC